MVNKLIKNIVGFVKRAKFFLIIPVVIIVALLLYRFKGLVVAATVNGEPISRFAVTAELEKEGGKQVLSSLITNALVLQEASKEKVSVTDAEVNDQINKITENLKTSGQDLNTALAAQGMTKKDLEYQIRLQVLVQKMAGKGVADTTDQEALDYFNKNQSSYAKGTKFDVVKEQIKTDLKDQKANQAVTTWINNLKSKAKVVYFVNY